jgi:uncharacterized protein
MTSDADRNGGWRLAAARSEYLRSAAEQPIEWFPWGEEAFALARRTNRPILLDIGASWCHWCHVMDEGTYSDPEVARLLRQHFVAVKVDRDEHPEIDRRFQRQVGAYSGEGGWPLTAFLNAEGEVFLGGTYFPPQDGLGRPGFRRVLKEVARLWKEEPDKIHQTTDAIRDALVRMGAKGSTEVRSPSPIAFIGRVRAEIHQSYDPVNGGFGFAPKFPHPTAISFLLWDTLAHGEPNSAARAKETLIRMADGGLYDQIGGGFHRYTTDEGWHIPHFEKMAVDNAALLSVFVEGARRFGEARLREVVEGTAAWIVETLADPKGGFGASQDADNAPGDDGSYFTWTRGELRAALTPDEFRLVARFFGVGSDGRMPHDPERNVLFRLMTIAEASEGLSWDEAQAREALQRAIEKLRAVRSHRPTPKIDHALYANLNGAFIRALAQAGLFLDDPRLVAHARQACDHFLEAGYNPSHGIAHRIDGAGPSGFGLLEDQAEFAYGAVELAGVTRDERYLRAAEELLGLIDREFRGEDGLFRDVAPSLYDGTTLPSLSQPTYPLEDSPHLSANATVALALERFASLTGRDEFREKAAHLLHAMEPRLQGAGLFAAGTALATGLIDTPAARVVVKGEGPEAAVLLRSAFESWHPNLWVFPGVPPAPFSSPEELVAASSHSGESRALVCFGTRCLAPVTDPAQLPILLRSGGSEVAA